MADTAETAPSSGGKSSTRRAAANGAGTATRSRRASRANPDDLEAQVAQLQADLKTITQTIGRLGEHKVDEVRGMAKSRAADIRGKGEDIIESAHDEFNAFERQIKDTIRERPLTAVAGAIALGYILAVVTR